MRRLLPAIAAALVIGAVAVGLVQAGGDGDTGATRDEFDLPAALAELRGAPAPLAALHAQAGRLLDGGTAAFEARLRTLRGYPVVVNKWASWCGPCRSEFPVFQSVATARGRTVAFLGVNSFDNRGDAEEFLRELPVPYPSYADPDEKVARAAGAPANYPITVFYDRRGERSFVHQGEYRTDADLAADIDRYAR